MLRIADIKSTHKPKFCFTEYTFGSVKPITLHSPQKIMETVASKVGIEEEKLLIQRTLNDYLQGRPKLDIERLRGAFHPNAYIRTIIDGKLVQWTLTQYLDLVAQATLQECQPELLSYNWDGDTGSAHVQLTFATFRFIDRFNLVKLDGKWLIMDKISYRQEPL